MNAKAFLVGIDDYSPYGQSGPDLRGCVNDVKDMANTLVIAGFSPRNIRLATDKAATMNGIMAGLSWLSRGAKKGDTLVFYFAGHGSRIPDTSGEEIDKAEEILCPHDVNFHNATFLTDDTLKKAFAGLPKGVNLEIIIDACHNGSVKQWWWQGNGTQWATTPSVQNQSPEESVQPSTWPTPQAGQQQLQQTLQIAQNLTQTWQWTPMVRFMEPPADLAFHLEYEPDMPSRKLLKPALGEREVVIVQGLNHTLWAASRENQTASEIWINGEFRGVFSYNFCRILRRSNGKITRRKLEMIISAAIKRAGYYQIPQLEVAQIQQLDRPVIDGVKEEFVEKAMTQSL